jgi:hypothetical protein
VNFHKMVVHPKGVAHSSITPADEGLGAATLPKLLGGSPHGRALVMDVDLSLVEALRLGAPRRSFLPPARVRKSGQRRPMALP